jgi:hypothetical protein
VSPIFGLAGKVGKLAPLASELPGSRLREPFAASGAPETRSIASGTDAGRPVVGSDIGEIPSPGRANWRRRRLPSGCAGADGPSGALGLEAEIDSESTFFVVSFATSGAEVGLGWGPGAVSGS